MDVLFLRQKKNKILTNRDSSFTIRYFYIAQPTVFAYRLLNAVSNKSRKFFRKLLWLNVIAEKR